MEQKVVLSFDTQLHKSNENDQNHELAPGHNLDVRRAEDPLPGNFASLWPAAVSKAGGATPVSYARMDRANIISLAVTEVQGSAACRISSPFDHYPGDFSKK